MGTKKCSKQSKNICARQQCGEKNTDAFPPRIITSDDALVHQYDPLMKRKITGIASSVVATQEKNSW